MEDNYLKYVDYFKYIYFPTPDDITVQKPFAYILRKNPDGSINLSWRLEFDEVCNDKNAMTDEEIFLFIQDLHTKEFKRASDNLIEIRKKILELPSGEDLRTSESYLEKVVSKFLNWFLSHDLPVPDTSDNYPPKTGKQKYKKDIPSEIKKFLKVVKETKNPFPTLGVLQEKTGISPSTWSRRFKEKDFFVKLTGLIFKEREKLPTDSDLSSIYDDTQAELSSRYTKKDRSKKRDMVHKGKRDTSKEIEEYSTQTPKYFPEKNEDDEIHQASRLTNTYKFILN